jgi:hypothetical protein
MTYLDRAAACAVCILGFAHLVVGRAAFVAPTEGRIWFAAAGFLLLVTGIANLAAARESNWLTAAAAGVGSVSILVIGALLARIDPDLLAQPQTLVLLGIGLLLTIQRARGLSVAMRRRKGRT